MREGPHHRFSDHAPATVVSFIEPREADAPAGLLRGLFYALPMSFAIWGVLLSLIR